MPSTNSSSMPNVFDSSTVTTPSLPTLSSASAITSPIAGSAAEIDATLATSSRVSTFLAWFMMASTAAETPFSMPRFSAIGFAPAATFFMPRRTIARASTVAVVVPSAARRHPRARAPAGGSLCSLLAEDGEDVAGRQDQVLLALDLDLRAAVLAVDHLVADRDVERNAVPFLEAAGPNGHDGALLGLLLRRVRDHDARGRGLLLLARVDHDAILERLQVELLGHPFPSCSSRCVPVRAPVGLALLRREC